MVINFISELFDRKKSRERIFKIQPSKIRLCYEGDSKKVLEVYIDDLCPFITTLEERKSFENPTIEERERLAEMLYDFERHGKEVVIPREEVKLSFCSGGLLHVNEKDALLIERTKNATCYTSYLTACLGISEDVEEAKYPRITQIREGLEELIYTSEGGEILYVPSLLDAFEGDVVLTSYLWRINPDGIVWVNAKFIYSDKIKPEIIIKESARNIGLKPKEIKKIDGEIIKSNDSVVRVFVDRKRYSETFSRFYLDPEISEISVIGILQLDLDFNEIEVHDGELTYDGKPLKRTIYPINRKALREALESKIEYINCGSEYYIGGRKNSSKKEKTLRYVPHIYAISDML